MEVNCQCGPIGASDEIPFTAVRDHRLYLNTEYPAPCSGTVERWRHCYYRPTTINRGDRFRVTWAVYRRMRSGNDTSYVRVESSVRTATRRDNQIPNSGSFWCRNQNVNDFDIEAGDIIGACIYDPPQSNRKQMDIVGDANGYSVMQMSVDDQCGDNLMPSMISSSQLLNVGSRILHLYATISSMFIPEYKT